MAAWDDDGTVRGRSPTGCWISAAPSRHSHETEPQSCVHQVIQGPPEAPGFVPADWYPVEDDGLVASPLYEPVQGETDVALSMVGGSCFRK